LVNGFIAGYLCLILVFLVAGREEWPFCIYPMFATLDRRADFEGSTRRFSTPKSAGKSLCASTRRLASLFVTYHYPDSGDFQSTIIRKVMILQYNKGDL
jgi:hypothetical protein